MARGVSSAMHTRRSHPWQLARPTALGSRPAPVGVNTTTVVCRATGGPDQQEKGATSGQKTREKEEQAARGSKEGQPDSVGDDGSSVGSSGNGSSGDGSQAEGQKQQHAEGGQQPAPLPPGKPDAKRDEDDARLLTALSAAETTQQEEGEGLRRLLPRMSRFELNRLLELLVEYGGVFGTAAVAIGLLTNVDPFGGFHWDQSDIITGLLVFAPVLALDLVLTLPDFSSSPEEAKQTMRLFVKPELLDRLQIEQRKLDTEKALAEAAAAVAASAAAAAAVAAETSGSGAPAAASPGAPLPGTSSGRGKIERGVSRGGGSVGDGLYVSITELAAAAPLTGAATSTRKLKLALEMLQEFYLRNNPTAIMAPATELFVILVSCLADEMLYRAVLLTLAGAWVRDRMVEGGADDVLALPVVGQVDTLSAGAWTALSIGIAGGVAAFTLRALREAAIVAKAQEMGKRAAAAAAEAEQKQRKPRALPGWEAAAAATAVKSSSSASAKLPPDLVSEVAMQLSGSLGSLNATVWALEGAREVLQVAASGTAFILTSNLAAPYAGSVVVQVVFSACQRLMLERKIMRRRTQASQLLEKRRALAAAAADRALAELAAEAGVVKAEAGVGKAEADAAQAAEGVAEAAAAKAAAEEAEAGAGAAGLGTGTGEAGAEAGEGEDRALETGSTGATGAAEGTGSDDDAPLHAAAAEFDAGVSGEGAGGGCGQAADGGPEAPKPRE
ncbi:hypothetical protein FOA52_001932 [Chlamydomonas sp. UWO 241]|nr:hypothetical protein FOA52_001932 [Chlamydomonas sp. UWO 241]